MLEVKLFKKDPSQTIDIVRELRTMGWVQGKDFDFSYNKPTFDDH